MYDADIYYTSFPNYIRLLNFGRRKTGWLTYIPKKVFVDNLGNIQKIIETWTHKHGHRLSEVPIEQLSMHGDVKFEFISFTFAMERRLN